MPLSDMWAWWMLIASSTQMLRMRTTRTARPIRTRAPTISQGRRARQLLAYGVSSGTMTGTGSFSAGGRALRGGAGAGRGGDGVRARVASTTAIIRAAVSWSRGSVSVTPEALATAGEGVVAVRRSAGTAVIGRWARGGARVGARGAARPAAPADGARVSRRAGTVRAVRRQARRVHVGRRRDTRGPSGGGLVLGRSGRGRLRRWGTGLHMARGRGIARADLLGDRLLGLRGRGRRADLRRGGAAQPLRAGQRSHRGLVTTAAGADGRQGQCGERRGAEGRSGDEQRLPAGGRRPARVRSPGGSLW